MSETESLTIWINGRAVTTPAGSVVSAVMLSAGVPCRTSTSGQPRTAFCGMGICFECRAVVNRVPHVRTCQLACRDGMTVETEL